MSKIRDRGYLGEHLPMGLSYSDTGPWWWEAAETPPVGWRPFRSTRTTIRQTRRYRVKKREGKKNKTKKRSKFDPPSHIYIYICTVGEKIASIDGISVARFAFLGASAISRRSSNVWQARRERESGFFPRRGPRSNTC